MPPVVIAAGVVGAATIAGGVMAKSAADKQSEAAVEAAKVNADAAKEIEASKAEQKVEEVIHRTPAESGAATISSYQLELEFQRALQASLQAGNEYGIDWG